MSGGQQTQQQQKNLAIIKQACRDKDSFLGISTANHSLCHMPWSSEPTAVAEIWRWMVANDFSARSVLTDCGSLFAMFNLGRDSVYTADQQARLRTEIFERMRNVELPYLGECGLLDSTSDGSPGGWNQAKVELWARCDWDATKIRKATIRSELECIEARTLPELQHAMDAALTGLAQDVEQLTTDIRQTVLEKHGPRMAAVDVDEAGPAIDDLLRDMDGLHVQMADRTHRVFRAVKEWAIGQSHARCLRGELDG